MKTVLVAEDELLIRLLVVDALTEAGFEAEHAEEALTALKSGPIMIHLLFTDIHTRGLVDGLQLAHHVRLTWPHIALIIASGEASPPLASLPQGSVFLPKPYHVDHVVEHAHALTSA